MIRIAAGSAVGGFLFMVLAAFAVVWVRRIIERSKKDPDNDLSCCVRQCPYCAHVIVDHAHDREKEILVCPVCKSYFEEDIR